MEEGNDMVASPEATVLEIAVMCYECGSIIQAGEPAFEKFQTESDDLEFLCEICRSVHQ